MAKKPYYITTAIAYTSGKPHIGNTYEIVLADSIARFKRAQGYDVRFQTGTDEHGQKIELKAQDAGVSPQEFVDGVAAQIKDIWDMMNTSYDKFIRTTDDYHELQVQKIIKKLYEKSELGFALAWIIAYVVLASTGDNISADIGVLKSVTLPILILLSAILLLFIKRNGLFEKYGLCKSEIPASKVLFYIPLIILLTANLWYGVTMNVSPLETILYILSMLCVGFLEEMIFRGFLFHAMAKDGVKSAIIVSSVTFGIGHLVNLVNGSGADLLPNILQVIYAVAIGFTFVMIYYKTKSLIPCIITHSIFNGLSTFANEAVMTMQRQMISGVLIAVIAGGYALYIRKTVDKL